MSERLDPREVFKRFVKGVFYVGKGKKSRPFSHLQDATQQNKVSEWRET